MNIQCMIGDERLMKIAVSRPQELKVEVTHSDRITVAVVAPGCWRTPFFLGWPNGLGRE